VFGPVVARPASKLLGTPLARLRGVTGKLARQNAMRNPRRTSGTATALMVGVGVVTLFTVFAASMKQSVNDAVAGSVRGELVISAGQWGGGGMSTDLAADVRKLPEVAGAAGIGIGAALVNGDSELVTVLDPPAASSVLDLDVVAGSLDDLATDEIAVTQRTADEEEWTVGSPVDIAFADGSTTAARVGAIYDARDIVLPYVMPRAMWNEHVAQAFDATVVIALRDGVPLETGRAAVQRVADAFRAPDVQDKAQYIDSAAGNIDQVLALIYVMLFLAIVIALMGIANTLSLAVYERTGELGILRAVGTTRAQVRSMVRWESVIVAVFGTLAGIGVGVFLGWGLVRVAGAAGVFDGFAIPVTQLVLVLFVGAIAGVLAAVRPARRAARLDVLDAIAVA
jgi:putative ABC transport system permease protein